MCANSCTYTDLTQSTVLDDGKKNDPHAVLRATSNCICQSSRVVGGANALMQSRNTNNGGASIT